MITIIKITIVIIGLYLSYYTWVKGRGKNIALVLISSIILVGASMYIIISSMPSRNDNNCKYYFDFKKKFVFEKVIDKMDTAYHQLGKIIILQNLQSNKIDTIFLEYSQEKVLESVNKLDTVIKKINNDSLFKLNQGKLMFLDKMNCGCDINRYNQEHDIKEKHDVPL